MKKCKHCKMDLAIRNPSGHCDHLYYPENCNVCNGKFKTYWKHLQDENDTRMACPYNWGSVLIGLGGILIAFGIGVFVGGRL